MVALHLFLGLSAVALLLLVSTWWTSSVFIPAAGVRSASVAGQAPALRGATGAAPLENPVQEGVGLGALVPLCIAILGLGAVRRQQQVPAVRRRFFGGGASPPPKKAQSYKDYTDPWLSSADLGFDPLNVAVGTVFDKGTAVVPETTYYNYRESEVKHGRFAMAGFLAIFAEAADRGALLKQLGVAGAADNLDGTLGLDEVQAPVLLVGLGIQALAEYGLQSTENDGDFTTVEYNRDRCPGDLGFDPLGFGSGVSGGQRVELHNVEVNLGRLAMIGITSFLFKEFVVKDPTIASKIL